MNTLEHEKNIKNVLNAMGYVVKLKSSNSLSIDQWTAEVLRRSLALQASLLTHKVTADQFLYAHKEFGFGPNEFLELRQLFETYIGVTSRLSSRVDLDYLASIPLMVLIGCMSAVRRADYLVERGQTTSVAVNPNSIVVPLMLPSSGEVYASDLKYWSSPAGARIVAPYATERFREVNLAQYEYMEFFDNVLTSESIPSFYHNTLAPKYDKPKLRYYDALSDKPEVFNGYHVSYIVPDPVMLAMARFAS